MIMKKTLLSLYCVLFFATGFMAPLWAQQPVVNASLDSTVIWIGEQTRLSFEVDQQPGQVVQFPLFSDRIPGGLEVVEPLRVDTVAAADGLIRVTHSYVVTAFEDSLLYIPPFPFAEAGDTLWSKSLSLKVVQPFEVDMEANSITDIKPVYRPKFNWAGLFKIILLVIVLAALAVGLYVLVRKYIQKKPVFETAGSEPDRPPHEVALEGLTRLRDEKLWQQDRLKEYYTQLTDIIREYIDRTFAVNAREMTSDEILDGLRYMKKDSKELYGKLQSMLQTADLVKFAKWKPLADECEQSLKDAFLFVEQTKPADPDPAEAQSDSGQPTKTENKELNVNKAEE